ncbi:MAG: hypothetical protein ACXW3Z_16535 [Limisphaerales bacterium]
MNSKPSQAITILLGSLLLVSVAINLGLALYAFRKTPSANEYSEHRRQEHESRTMNAAQNGGVEAILRVSTNAAKGSFGWQSVESADYKEYIGNLRAVGCPEETIRDIIRADVKKLYAEKRKEVRQAAPRFEYWKGDDFLRGAGREAWMKLLSLNDEEGKVLRALGIEPEINLKNAKNSAGMDWMLDFLDERKKAELFRLRKEVDEKLALRDESVNVEQVLKEMDRKLKAMLTPEEALQYDLRFSPYARGQHGLFEPTEDEFIGLYKARKGAADEAESLEPAGTAAERSERREASERNLQAAIEQALGPERYAEYQMGQDYAYRQIRDATKEAGLENAAAKQIYEMRKVAQGEMARIESSSEFSEQQRAAALEAIRGETARSIQNLLGSKGWQRFQRDNPWLEKKGE